MRRWASPAKPGTFTRNWIHPDPAMDALYQAVSARVESDASRQVDPVSTLSAIHALAGLDGEPRWQRRPSPRLSEPWFCCAEPAKDQLAAVVSRRARSL
jgi:hypothetical protein